MSFIWRKLIAFMFICQSSRMLIESSPRIYPDSWSIFNIIDVIEGEELGIICDASSGEPNFHYAETNVSLLQRNFSYHNSTRVYKKSSVLSEDSGWYGCSESVDNLYIFVRTNSGYFLDDKVSSMLRLDKNILWKVPEIDYEAWISCKPNSPIYNVRVYKDGKPYKPLLEEIDPKIDYIPVVEPGTYKCELTADKRAIAVKEYNVTEEYEDPQLVISGDQCSHFNNETEFRVNCSIAYPFLLSEAHNYYRQKSKLPKWTFPNSEVVDSIINEYPSIQHPIFDNYLISTNELVIRTISDELTREFECSAAYGNGFLKQKMHLIVNRPDFRGINLITTFSEASRIIKEVGEDVQFMVGIEAYPDQPDIIWHDPKEREILTDGKKFKIDNSCTHTTLTIIDLSLEDRGVYRVEAKTLDPESSKTLIFNLDVWGKGLIKTLDNVAEYYMRNESAKIDCIVDKSKELYITWSFRERPDSLSNLSKSTVDEKVIESNKTTIVWKVQSSGYITCTACDISDKVPNKCENLTRPIFMTDVPGGFGIISPNREIITNETVELICAASVYHFTDKVQWLDDSGASLVVSDRKNLNFIQTELSYQAILTFSSVGGADNGTYICSSTNHQRQVKRVNYTLRVHIPVEPYFRKTNMKGSIEKNLNTTTSSQHIILECYPGGKPQPVVSWWKDAAQIKTTNQTDNGVCRHSFRNDNQQLYIDNLDGSCSALYQCQATNTFGVVRVHQNIIMRRTELTEPKRTESPTSDGTSSTNVMLLIVFVGLIVIIVCLVLTIFSWRKRRRAEERVKEMALEDFFEGALDFLKSGLTDAERSQFQPYQEKWEFPLENLDMKGELGSGSFGVVEMARAKDLFGKGTNWLVAIKKPNEKQDKYVSIRALARELKTMMHLGKHLNVVNLLGACTKEIKNFELLVIIEYCAFGNLSNYLKNNGSEFISQIDGDTRSCESSHKISNTVDSSEKSPKSDVVDGGKEHFSDAIIDTVKAKRDRELGTDDTPPYYSGPPNQRKFADEEFLPLRTSTLLSWAFQVSNGMEYLRRRRVIHGDLAARNILLAKRNVVKISDFGLSKELHERNEYKKTTDGPLPVKWMAIETLRDGIFSTQSDIWSFGIVLWEFFELGEQPYLNIQKSELLEKLGNGYRMGKPKHATEKLYDLMMQCWNEKPNNRPSFINLVDVIGSLMDQEEKMFLEKLAFSYQNENKIPLEGGKDDESPDGNCASIVESFLRCKCIV